jgi:hypothetical protein
MTSLQHRQSGSPLIVVDSLRPSLEHVPYFEREVIRQAWLEQEPITTGFVGLLCGGPERLTGQHDDAGTHRSMIAAQAARQLQAGDVWQPHIRDDDVGMNVARTRESFCAILCGHWLKAIESQGLGVHRAGILVIVNDQHDR